MVELHITVDLKNTSLVAQNEYLIEMIEEVAHSLDTFHPDAAVVGRCHLLLMRALERAAAWGLAPEEEP